MKKLLQVAVFFLILINTCAKADHNKQIARFIKQKNIQLRNSQLAFNFGAAEHMLIESLNANPSLLSNLQSTNPGHVLMATETIFYFILQIAKPNNIAMNIALVLLAKIYNTFSINPVNSYSPTGYTLMHQAIISNKPQLLYMFLNWGLDPDLCARQNSLLHCAVLVKNREAVHLLLLHNANPNIKNGNNETPLHLAAKHKLTNIMEILSEKGASLLYQSSFDLPQVITPEDIQRCHSR